MIDYKISHTNNSENRESSKSEMSSINDTDNVDALQSILTELAQIEANVDMVTRVVTNINRNMINYQYGLNNMNNINDDYYYNIDNIYINGTAATTITPQQLQRRRIMQLIICCIQKLCITFSLWAILGNYLGSCQRQRHNAHAHNKTPTTKTSRL